jgi:hypothetical protein
MAHRLGETTRPREDIRVITRPARTSTYHAQAGEPTPQEAVDEEARHRLSPLPPAFQNDICILESEHHATDTSTGLSPHYRATQYNGDGEPE